MVRNYFDIHLIGANEEPVPIVFTVPSFSLGKDVVVRTPDGEPVNEVTAGCMATVPLWAAEVLRRGGYVSVHTPPNFSIAVFREFKTDPLAASLATKSPYYYEAGLRLCRLVGNPSASGGMSAEGTRLTAQLFRLYQLRYHKIIGAAAKRGFDLKDVQGKLSVREQHLLDRLLRGQSEEQLWHAHPQ